MTNDSKDKASIFFLKNYFEKPSLEVNIDTQMVGVGLQSNLR